MKGYWPVRGTGLTRSSGPPSLLSPRQRCFSAAAGRGSQEKISVRSRPPRQTGSGNQRWERLGVGRLVTLTPCTPHSENAFSVRHPITSGVTRAVPEFSLPAQNDNRDTNTCVYTVLAGCQAQCKSLHAASLILTTTR